jgi:hypothetical protein
VRNDTVDRVEYALHCLLIEASEVTLRTWRKLRVPYGFAHAYRLRNSSTDIVGAPASSSA